MSRRQRNHLGFFEGEYVEVGSNLLFQIGARYAIDFARFEHGPRGGGPKRITDTFTVEGRVLGTHTDMAGEQWLEVTCSDTGYRRSVPVSSDYRGRIVSMSKTAEPFTNRRRR